MVDAKFFFVDQQVSLLWECLQGFFEILSQFSLGRQVFFGRAVKVSLGHRTSFLCDSRQVFFGRAGKLFFGDEVSSLLK